MGELSTLVVRGTVAGVRSYWNEQRTKVFTETRVTVDETYKGTAGSEVRIVQPGGVVGHVKVNVSGALRWKQGEEVLLFLEPYRRGTYQVSGFSQGKFGIERDPETGRMYVEHPPLEGIELVGAPEGEAGAVEAPARIPLNRFINRAIGLE
jgi:hypothetical protein